MGRGTADGTQPDAKKHGAVHSIHRACRLPSIICPRALAQAKAASSHAALGYSCARRRVAVVVVDHGGEDRQGAVGVVDDLDDAGLCRPVDVGGGADVPERAGPLAAEPDGVGVGVAVDPQDQARMGGADRLHVVGQVARQVTALRVGGVGGDDR